MVSKLKVNVFQFYFLIGVLSLGMCLINQGKFVVNRVNYEEIKLIKFDLGVFFCVFYGLYVFFCDVWSYLYNLKRLFVFICMIS